MVHPNQLSDIRIKQPNLIYVTNLPYDFPIHLLSNDKHFGKYGQIKKIATNQIINSTNLEDKMLVCYITYTNEDAAYQAILNVDQSFICYRGNNYILRVTYGTTKYCQYFLNNDVCKNLDCMYLHSMSSYENCVSKENILVGNGRVLHDFVSIGRNKYVLGCDGMIEKENINEGDNLKRSLVECKETFHVKISTFEPHLFN